jgi:hypothetical protein
VLVVINLNSSAASTTIDLGAFGVAKTGAVPVSLESGVSLPAVTVTNRAAYPVSLPARGWLIASVGLTPPADTSHADIDGRSIPFDAGAQALVSTQAVNSSFGDNVGELNRLYARADGDALRVSITGNIPQDGTALNLFVDVDPAAANGQNRLVTAHLPAPPGGLALLDGTQFDAGFAPDALYYVNTVGGNVYVDRVTFTAEGAAATKEYRGNSTLNSGRGTLAGGTNPAGVEVAFDNTNTAGISASSVASAATATGSLLKLAEAPGADAADALACAITHAQASRLAPAGSGRKIRGGRWV